MKLPTPANDNIADDEPLPLAEACGLFPYAKLTPSTLRAEHAAQVRAVQIAAAN